MPTLTDENNPYPPYASLNLWGEDLSPQKITDALGVSPTRSFQRGDKRKDGNKWPHGIWFMESKEQVQSLEPIAHVEWLLTKIETFQKQLNDVIWTQELNAELSVFWIMPTSNQHLSIEPELAKRIAATGLRLEFSIYSPD